MQTTAPDLSALDLMLGFAATVTFFTFTFCVATLRSCVDEEKLRKEESVSIIMASQIPPERVLTDAGLRRVRIAKISIGMFMAFAAIMVIRKNFL